MEVVLSALFYCPICGVALNYSDTEAQSHRTKELHADMLGRDTFVNISQNDLDALSQYYPDLRTVKREKRNEILKERIQSLRAYLSEELTEMLGKKSFEMRINGETIDVRVYRAGIEHVRKKLTRNKAAMLKKTEEVFNKAEYAFSLPHDPHSTNADIEIWDYFYVPLKIGEGAEFPVSGVRIAVRTIAGEKGKAQAYDWEIKKETSVDRGVPAKEATSTGVSLDVSNKSIPRPTDEVKNSLPARDNNAALRNPTRHERRSWLDNYADTYGQIPEGEDVNSRGDQRIPRRIDSNSKIRQTYRTYAEAATTPDDFVGELEREIKAF